MPLVECHGNNCGGGCALKGLGLYLQNILRLKVAPNLLI